jgi:hypothetical protein
MSSNDETKSGKPGEGSDSEDSLEKELEKESAEGKDSIGDVNSNRNLSGASSWDTLPDDEADSDSNKDSGKKSS